MKGSDIPHVEANYVDLARAVGTVCDNAHRELANVLETLPSTPADVAKKQALLEVLVRARQEFVRTYVLTKWARVSEDVTKCIDVVAWLHGQRNCFDNLNHMLVGLGRDLGAAKSRNPDLQTAVQVLTRGAPTTFGDHDMAPKKKLKPQTILRTLRDLNVLLSVQLAQSTDIPPQFKRYKIANGRATFTVANAFEVDVGIADDTLDGPFFFIDFRLLFGDRKELPIQTRGMLERAGNSALAQRGLSALYSLLMKFALNYKLALIYKQIMEMSKGLWSGTLRHRFYQERSLIALEYWVSQHATHRPKSTLEIGIFSESDLRIAVRWSRQGEEVAYSEHQIQFGGESTDVAALLEYVTTLHLKHIISCVYTKLRALLGDSSDMVSLCSDGHKLRFRLTSLRSTVFTVDRLTGKTVLENATSLILSAERSLNELVSRPDQAASVLFKLRLLSLENDIRTRACATGWTAQNVTLSTDEMKTHFGFTTRYVLFLRQPQWPSNWFVVVTVPEDGSLPLWWIAKLRVRKDTAWTAECMDRIHVNQDLDSLYDYELLTQMVTFASHRIVLHPILDELRAAKTPFRLLRSAQHTPVVAIDNSALVSSWSHSSLLVVPEMTAGSMDMKLHVQGRAKTVMNLPSNDSIDFDASTGIYKLTLDGAHVTGFSLVAKLKERLQQIEQIVGYIELIKDLGLDLVTASMQQIKFKLEAAQVSVDIPSEVNPSITLNLSPGDPHNLIHSYLQETLNSSGLRPVVWLLQTTRNLYITLQKLQKTRGGDFSLENLEKNISNLSISDLETRQKQLQPRFSIVPRSAAFVRLVYPGKMNIDVTLVRHSAAADGVKFFIKESPLELPPPPQPGQPPVPPVRKLQQVWNGSVKPDGDVGKVVYLNDGIACTGENVGRVVEWVDRQVGDTRT